MSLDAIIKRVFGELDTQAMLQSLREVIAEPTSNLTLSVLLVSVVSLILLIVVVAILMLVVGTEDEDEDEDDKDGGAQAPENAAAAAGSTASEGASSGSSRAAAKRRLSDRVAPDSRLGRVLALAGGALVPLLLTAAIVASYTISSYDAYCLTCHATQIAAGAAASASSTATGTADTGPHAGPRCVACHEGPLATSVVGNSLDRARHLVAFAVGRREGRGAVVPSERCLSCHSAIVDRVLADVERGLLMSHAEPVAAGVPCGECHRDSGHRDARLEPGMSACLVCHDDIQASAACSTCHTKETSFAARDRRVFVPTQTIGRGDCGGCHSQATCDSCHGMRMPHDIQFLSYEHARSAGFDKKELCWRCHTMDDCGKCHEVRPRSVGYWGHTTGDSWKRQHGKVQPGVVAGCGCHGRSPYVKAGKDYCLACHDPGIR